MSASESTALVLVPPGAEVLDRLGISVSNVKNSVLGLLTAK